MLLTLFLNNEASMIDLSFNRGVIGLVSREVLLITAILHLHS